MKRGFKALGIASGLFLLAIALLFAWRTRPENAIVVEPGGEIRYDDFAFSVDGVRRARSLGEGAARVEAQGEFVIVTLGVHNHAQRVDFSFRPETVRLVGDGVEQTSPFDQSYREVLEHSERSPQTEYTATPVALAALAPSDGCAGEIPAGRSCTTELAFDVPRGTTGLTLRMRFSGLFFDALDTLIYGRMSLALPDG